MLYPLRFQPLFRRYIWGGRRLGTVLGKPVGEGDDYAESWEVVDHGDDQSVVAEGPLAGKTLHEIAVHHFRELLGQHAAPSAMELERSAYLAVFTSRNPFPRFPLLFKLLDCNRALSVQVHPNDEQAAKLTPPDLGKTEAWVILDAAPGSAIYAGLKPGVSRDDLARNIAAGRTEAALHQFEPRAGDCVFIPAGTVHALGAGLLVAEIQQASDTTYRLFDWNRVGPDGKPRPLHIEQSLDVIDYSRGPVDPQSPQPTATPGVERLVACDKFVLDRRTFTGEAQLGGDDRFRIVSVVAGEVHLVGDPTGSPLARGQTALVPASAGAVRATATTPATLLEAYLP
jgi:mannose-6-phosphate isomerase